MGVVAHVLVQAAGIHVCIRPHPACAHLCAGGLAKIADSERVRRGDSMNSTAISANCFSLFSATTDVVRKRPVLASKNVQPLRIPH